MSESVKKTDKIVGKVTVEYSGKGPREQEIAQGHFALPVASKLLELLTFDNSHRVEVIKAICTGGFKDWVGWFPSERKVDFGNVIDFMVILGDAPDGKLKITIRWEGPAEKFGFLHVIAIEHPWGNPVTCLGAATIKNRIDEVLFEPKIQKVAMGMVEVVIAAIGQLKFPLQMKMEKLSRYHQKMEGLRERLREFSKTGREEKRPEVVA